MNIVCQDIYQLILLAVSCECSSIGSKFFYEVRLTLHPAIVQDDVNFELAVDR